MESLAVLAHRAVFLAGLEDFLEGFPAVPEALVDFLEALVVFLEVPVDFRGGLAVFLEGLEVKKSPLWIGLIWTRMGI